MKAKDLIGLNDKVRKLITEHIQTKGITLNQFAKECGIHQNQMWMYVHSGDSKKGLHTFTLEKIGNYIAKNL